MRSKLSPSHSSISSNVIGLCLAMSRPSSSIAATANGSSSPLRTPAEPTYVRPKKCLNSPAAIGERTEFIPHANSTACGLAERGASIGSDHLFEHELVRKPVPTFRAHALALPVQHADQREQAPRGVEVDADLFLEPLHQQFRTFVVQTTPPHIDCLDLA